MPEHKEPEEYEELEHAVERREHNAEHHSHGHKSKSMSKKSSKSHESEHEAPRRRSGFMTCLVMPVLLFVIAGMVIFAAIGFQPAAPVAPVVVNPDGTTTEPIQAQVAVNAPGFSLMKLDGTLFTLSDFQGSIVVLNFWSTVCAACPAEAYSLQAIQDGYGSKGVVVLAIDKQDTDAAIRAFVSQNNLTFAHALDTTGSVSDLYGVSAVPQTVIINRDGTIAQSLTIPVNYQSLKNILDPLLAGG